MLTVEEDFLKSEPRFCYHKWGRMATGQHKHRHCCHILNICTPNLSIANTLPTSLAAQSFTPLLPTPERVCETERFSPPQPDILGIFPQIIPVPMETFSIFSLDQ